jgi:hypothetical protein
MSLKIFTSEVSETQFVKGQLNFTDKVVGSITSTQETSTVLVCTQVLVAPVLAVVSTIAQVSAETVAYMLVKIASVKRICFLFNIGKKLLKYKSNKILP